MPYEYAAAGTWRIGKESQAVDVNGDSRGRGRLVGVLMNDYRLSPEFELGTQGTVEFPAAGALYLRCRSAWNELADDSGRVAVKFNLKGRGRSRRTAETKNHVADRFIYY